MDFLLWFKFSLSIVICKRNWEEVGNKDGNYPANLGFVYGRTHVKYV